MGAPRRAGERARLLAACSRYRERLADELGLDAEFVCADVYDAFGALGERRFDIVYTGLGAINWLPDIEPAAVGDSGLLHRLAAHPADLTADEVVGQPVTVGRIRRQLAVLE